MLSGAVGSGENLGFNSKLGLLVALLRFSTQFGISERSDVDLVPVAGLVTDDILDMPFQLRSHERHPTNSI